MAEKEKIIEFLKSKLDSNHIDGFVIISGEDMTFSGNSSAESAFIDWADVLKKKKEIEITAEAIKMLEEENGQERTDDYIG